MTSFSILKLIYYSVTASSKFNYAPDTTYEFKYEVETKTQMLGASEDHSTIGISATVDIEIHSKCEFILQVSFYFTQ